MAKRRIYEIAKERGVATQELAELLRAAGVEVKSNLSSVDEEDVDRVLAPARVPEAQSEPQVEQSAGRGAPSHAEAAPPKLGSMDRGRPAEGRPGYRGEEPRAKTQEPGTQWEQQSAPSRMGPRKGRARARGPRLEDLPTVVGPGVPLRKGVKPPGTVHIKGEEPKPASKAAPKPERPRGHSVGPAVLRPEAPRVPGRPDDKGRPMAERPPRAVAPPPLAQPTQPSGREGRAAGRRPGHTQEVGGRMRRGEDKPSRRRVIIDSQAGRKGKDPRERKGASAVVEVERPVVKKRVPGTEAPVTIPSGATVKDLADQLELSPTDIIKTMMKLGEMVTITQSLADEAILILAEEFDRQVEIQHAEEEVVTPGFEDHPEELKDRAPVVTIMGHVDHGKTSLLDAIRETEVAKYEAGGITQHIGAYQVLRNHKMITFIDTPGHEAFTAMRARGAKVTDVAVIVVAANDGVMPQTVEAIDHAKAAEVPIVVAINKIDLADANPERVKQQLSELGLVPPNWGGDTEMVEVSAKQRLNLDELMDIILLVSELQELRANPSASASGVIIEAQLDVGRGPIATMLVQRGTLRVGDVLVSGEAYGKVKAMFDFKGEQLHDAGPAMPVQVLGFGTVPVAGEFVMAVSDEREARQRAQSRTARLRMEQEARGRGGVTLDDFFRRIREGVVKELPLVVKGDVAGSVEALDEALGNISHPEVKLRVIHSGVGGINESDVMLASASNAVVIGFNVRPSAAAKALAEQEGVDVRSYRVIYKAIEDIQAALLGMLEPVHVEEEIGSAEVRKVFRASRVGAIAGSYVQSGKIVRNAKARVVRDGSIVYEGAIDSLKRFADDVREVLAGYECGLHLDGYDDVKEGDVIEAYEIREVARTK